MANCRCNDQRIPHNITICQPLQPQTHRVWFDLCPRQSLVAEDFRIATVWLSRCDPSLRPSVASLGFEPSSQVFWVSLVWLTLGVNDPFLGALCPSKSGLINKHIVKQTYRETYRETSGTYRETYRVSQGQ